MAIQSHDHQNRIIQYIMGDDKKMRLAAVADLHVREADAGKWTSFFKEASQRADVLLICGDLTDTGDEAEAQVLADELKLCSIPVVCVLGNHDYEKGREKIIRQTIQQKDHIHVLDGESVVIQGVGFAGVKGFGGGFDNYMLSMFGEEAIKAFVQEAVNEALRLERALSRLDTDPSIREKIALLHYAPIRETVQGEPDPILPFLGCSRLVEPLERQHVRVAFHGHAHAGSFEGATPGGIKVYNVSRPVLQRAGLPDFYQLEV